MWMKNKVRASHSTFVMFFASCSARLGLGDAASSVPHVLWNAPTASSGSQWLSLCLPAWNLTYPWHLLLLKPLSEGCCFFPHSLNCTATSHFPSQTKADPFLDTLHSVFLPRLPACSIPPYHCPASPLPWPSFRGYPGSRLSALAPILLSFLVVLGPLCWESIQLLLLGSFTSSDQVTFSSFTSVTHTSRLHPEYFSTTGS